MQKEAKYETQVMGSRAVAKHHFGKEVKRKHPLEDYSNYLELASVKLPETQAIKPDLLALEHDIGLLQVLDSSTESGPESDSLDSLLVDENLTHEEVVRKRLQISTEEQSDIEKGTLRSKSQSCVVSTTMRGHHILTKHMKYGIDHEAKAVIDGCKMVP